MKRFILLFFLIAVATPLLPCTTFSFSDSRGHIVYGRNFDFTLGIGHIHVNLRGMRKIAFINPPEKPLEWISRYGSITFCQHGKEFPYGGMNEAGLVIEQMWLQETEYPVPDNRYGLSELQWIQYQLDNAETVDEVIQSDSLLRISNTSIAPIHFLVADADGNVAAIEYIKGRMVVHTGQNLPYPVLANCTYEHSLEYMSSVRRGDNKRYNAWTVNSSGRFAKAAMMIERFTGEKRITSYAFDILDSVKQQNGTQWSIVYDITKREILFKTRENPTIQKMELCSFDFSCSSQPVFAVMSDFIRNTAGFQEYSYEANFWIQEYVVNHVDFLKGRVPVDLIKATARYPETVTCVSG